MIGTMGSAVGVGAAVGGAAGPGAGGVVARPRLVGRLGAQARVSVLSAPPGSGKTVLLRSWISGAGLSGCAAWVPAGRGERDPPRFWLSVLAALRATGPGSALVRELTAAPDLDGWAITERLLADLAPMDDRVWLVVDDVHELSADALRQLELLIMRAPPGLRFVLAARHDVRLGLHRLRLEGELAEIRTDDLRFSRAEAAELFAAAGVDLPAATVAVLHERTEGWAAGLRLAALSLAGHPDPGRLAAEFSGTERTVAEYLLAEVLDRQPEQVRRLLLRTSILERVNGELAGLLTGDSGGERVLQDLEGANAFVVALDPGRSWFRYHHLFAGLLQLELRRTAPDEVTKLHHAAAEWFAARGYPVEAVRHAQAAQDWDLAARLLAEHWPGLHLDGQAATVHGLLARFPAEARAADAELAAVAAGDELTGGSLEAAERYLALAERASGRRAGPGRRSCCWAWSGCCWPASARTGRRWPRRRVGCRPWPRRRSGRRPAWARSCARWRWSASAAPSCGRPGSRRPSGIWSGVSRWRAGSGGPIWSSPAWPTRRRSSSSARLPGRWNSARRRPSWPNGTAGPASRPAASRA